MAVNSIKQGDQGVAIAIAHYVQQGFTVSIPLTVNTRYDLVVDDGEKLRRVQVKSTNFKTEHGVYRAHLVTNSKTVGGRGKKTLLTADECDEVFIHIIGGESYVLPSTLITGQVSINLGSKYSEWRVA